MNPNACLRRCAQVLLLSAVLTTSRSLVAGAEIDVARTNWTERWITNLIDVRRPTNIFVDEFHTNWLRQFVTNVVDVYVTNWINQEVTNMISVPATRTVRVTEYKTNWTSLRRTNELAVEAIRTNFVNQWQTNWKIFTLTNWETVLVLKTNWILQPVTNIVHIDLLTNRPVLAETAPAPSKPNIPKEIVVVASAVAATATPTEALQIEVTQTGRRPANGMVEVQLTVSWTAEPEAPLYVQQWRVEREDGAILSFGRERQFKPSLAVGRYKVEVRAQREENGPAILARSRLTVSPTEAVILSQASARN